MPCMMCCWIKRLGLTIHGTIIDTMVVAALVNENRFRYDLNSVAKEYTGKWVKMNQLCKKLLKNGV